MTMILKNFLPFNIFGIAPIFKKIPPLDGSVFGAVMCLSLSMLHVPSIMWFGLKEGVLSLVRLPFQPTILHDIRQSGIVDQAKLTPRKRVLRLWITLLWCSRIDLLKCYLQGTNANVVPYLQIQLNLIWRLPTKSLPLLLQKNVWFINTTIHFCWY